jgi:hypothetical protein
MHKLYHLSCKPQSARETIDKCKSYVRPSLTSRLRCEEMGTSVVVQVVALLYLPGYNTLLTIIRTSPVL